MPAKSSSDWLIPVNTGAGTILLHGRCLTHIRELLITPNTQTPGLALFLGRRRKNHALGYLYQESQLPTGSPSIRLRLANKSAFSEHPTLIADCDPQTKPLANEPEGPGYEVVPFNSETGQRDHIFQFILTRLLFLFVDVICIFAEDLGGLSKVRTLLERWATAGRDASSLEHRPRVLVISETENSSVTHDILEESDFIFQTTQNPDVLDAFASLNVLCLHVKGRLSGMAQHRPLDDEIKRALDLSRLHRKEEGCLFSAAHLDGFFHLALWHTSCAPDTPFDFVRAARWANTKIEDHAFHLTDFLELTSSHIWDEQAAFIASTLLLEAYPPSTHHFTPAQVFTSLFQHSCRDALKSVGMASSHSQLILEHLTRLYTRLSRGAGESRRIHEVNIAERHSILSSVISTQTCLVCLLRGPQHVLPCGHAYCDTCAGAYGRPSPGAEYQYVISSCILCHAACDTFVRVLPPTAGIRAITIDGGGVRGSIPLRFLEHFQLMLGLECPVHDLVDVAIGTSSGGFSVVKAFRQLQPVKDCQASFSRLVSEFFQKQPPPRSTWGRVCRAIRCWWADSWYDTSIWDNLLQEQFGRTERMFDVQEVSGIKVAVVTIANRQAVLLTNYRRVRDRTGEGGFYRVHQSNQPGLEVLTWQCVRATAAVPGLFTHIDIPGVGCCEDGGLKHNHPGLICRSETRYMWPSASEPATLVSLGTGAQAAKSSYGANRRHHRRGFALRLYDSVMDSMDGEEGWKKLLGGLEECAKQNYHRLNIEFPEKQPRLNSVNELSWISTLVDKVARAQVTPALTSLILTSLFFELSSAPRHEHGNISCIGAIRCRLKGHIFVNVLRRLYPAASTYRCGSETLEASPYENAVCESCSRYCVPIRFRVKSMSSTIAITIDLGDNHVKAVGGTPHSLEWFVKQQGFYLLGSTRSNGVPARAECQDCDRKIYRKTALRSSYDGHRKRVHFI